MVSQAHQFAEDGLRVRGRFRIERGRVTTACIRRNAHGPRDAGSAPPPPLFSSPITPTS